MPSEKVSPTEAWVRAYAPGLLTSPLAEQIAPFIRDDDLNGLAHFLQRCALNDRQSIPSWQKEQLREQFKSENHALERILQQTQQPTKGVSIQNKNEPRQEP